jgi:mono/diheme cytochrome c family protein
MLLTASLIGLTACKRAEIRSEPPLKRWHADDFGGVLSVGLEGYRDFESGRRLFMQQHCENCHRFASHLAPHEQGPDLKDKALQYTPEEALSHILESPSHQKKNGPVFHHLQQAEILDLLAYLLSGAQAGHAFFQK